jgi:hypothetical protein
MLDAMRKDTAVAFFRSVKERRKAMTQTASQRKSTAVRLFVAFELGWSTWRLAFGSALGEGSWQTTIPARDAAALAKAIRSARERLRLPAACPVLSCYEAGRDGFWLHRLLRQLGIDNLVVDSSSIEVNRRARRTKTDRLDAAKLLSMLLRHHAGERRIWSVVRVPTPEQEDGRHLQREIRTLKKEQTRLVNRGEAFWPARAWRFGWDDGDCSIRSSRYESGTGRLCLTGYVSASTRRSPGTPSFTDNCSVSSPHETLGSGRVVSAPRRSPDA